MRWKIYYGDGSTYSDLDGSPFDASPDNVQVIVMKDEKHGRLLVGKCDMYWWVEEEGEWFGLMDRLGYGLFDYLRQPGPKKVIFGRTTSNEAYDAVIKAAIADPDFPPKSAKAPGEEF